MADQIRTLIVEDEELARNLMKKFLAGRPEIELVAECENGFEGIKQINELKPDLVFLDIQMPKINGFEMLELLEHKPWIVFVTAYDQYALKAFEYHAVDYLLKPYAEERLFEAVDTVAKRMGKGDADARLYEQLSHYHDGGWLQRIVVKDRHKIHIVPVDQVRYIESMDDYVMIYTREGRHMKQKTMKYLENALNPKDFTRIHRSYIVRLEEITQIQQYEKETYVVVLQDNIKLKVSKTGYKKLKDVLNF